jgi:hypothetical protein
MSIAAGALFTGGCLCGKIRYRLRGPSLFVSQCCCRDCQLATGTGHTTIIGVHIDQLAVEGQPTTYTSVGDSGGSVTRHFCATCGGRLYTSGTLPGPVVMIQAGSLDDPGIVQPEAVIYTKDAVPWDAFDPNLPKYETMQPFDDRTRAAMRGDWRPT